MSRKPFAQALLGAASLMLLASIAAPWGTVGVSALGTTAGIDFHSWGMTVYQAGLPESRGWFHEDLKNEAAPGVLKLQFGFIVFLGGVALVLVAFATAFRRRAPDYDVTMASLAGAAAVILSVILYIVGVRELTAYEAVGFVPRWSWGFYMTGMAVFAAFLAAAFAASRPAAAIAAEASGGTEPTRSPAEPARLQ